MVSPVNTDSKLTSISPPLRLADTIPPLRDYSAPGTSTATPETQPHVRFPDPASSELVPATSVDELSSDIQVYAGGHWQEVRADALAPVSPAKEEFASRASLQVAPPSNLVSNVCYQATLSFATQHYLARKSSRPPHRSPFPSSAIAPFSLPSRNLKCCQNCHPAAQAKHVRGRCQTATLWANQ